MRLRNGPRFSFISAARTRWGGSEELWSAAAASLASAGSPVSVLKPLVDDTHPKVQRLRAAGCRVDDLERYPLTSRGFSRWFITASYPVARILQLSALALRLRLARPALVVVSQGVNFDGWVLARVCLLLKIPYVLVAQKAAEMYWPTDDRLDVIRSVFSNAVHCFFVSEHNRRLTEEQLGLELPRATVVRNPYLVAWGGRTDWPDETGGFRLACVGRLFVQEKGQDLLLRVMSREKWRSRPLLITFYGEGVHRASLTGMAARLGVTNVAFAGQVNDVGAIWRDNHALVLPSRAEGLPLAQVEAMLCGRVAIVTNVGGNAEIVDDEVTGFIASAPSEDALDEAMERAWQRRAEWRAIGEEAAKRVRTLVPEDPVRPFVEALLEACRAVGFSPPGTGDTPRERSVG